MRKTLSILSWALSKRKSELYFKRKWVFKRSIAHLWRSKTQSRYSKPLSPNTETRPSRWLPSIDLWLGSIVRAFSMVPFRNYGIICVSRERSLPLPRKGVWKWLSLFLSKPMSSIPTTIITSWASTSTVGRTRIYPATIEEYHDCGTIGSLTFFCDRKVSWKCAFKNIV